MEEYKKQLVEVAKIAYDKGIVNAYEGNLSIKVNDLILITPSGVCKGVLTKDMISVIDFDGNIIEGSYKQSSEYKLHVMSYIKRPDIKAVIHAHAPYTTAYAVANKAIETKAYPEMIMFFGRIPLAEYGTPSTDEIFRGVDKYLHRHDAVLLANHGILVVGDCIHSTFYKLEAAESIARVLMLAESLGGAKDLSDENLERLEMIKARNKKEKT